MTSSFDSAGPEGDSAGKKMDPKHVVEALSWSFKHFGDHIGEYALAGLGQFVAALVVGLIAIPVFYCCIFGAYVGMVGGMLGGMAVGASTGEEELAAGLAGLGAFGGLALFYLAIFGLFLGIMAVLAPISGSLLRAVDRKLRFQEELSFGSAFSTVWKQPIRDASIVVAVGLLNALGALLCLVGVVGTLALTNTAAMRVMLDGEPVFGALKGSFAHARENLGWTMADVGMEYVVSLVANYVPVIGPAYALLFHVVTYRDAIPAADGEPLLLGDASA